MLAWISFISKERERCPTQTLRTMKGTHHGLFADRIDAVDIQTHIDLHWFIYRNKTDIWYAF